ncbi:MAG: hypothetical protein LPK80_07395 [Bacteroidota bacterium]|nr:hypothetical protein [Bacteroidota bacterium]MDX5447739.1 hypothetical protein [Bacteroidota bacterium]
MITKISDIEIGKEYYLLLERDKRTAKKTIVHAIVNEKEEFISNKTEILLSIFYGGKEKSTNFLYVKEIGIGETKEEAYENYGKFIFEENDSFLLSKNKLP